MCLTRRAADLVAKGRNIVVVMNDDKHEFTVVELFKVIEPPRNAIRPGLHPTPGPCRHVVDNVLLLIHRTRNNS
jgi:hypothetical protein